MPATRHPVRSTSRCGTIAGKLCDAPIATLLGGWRKTLPCYASSVHGDENGGLTRPEDFAEIALQCKEEFVKTPLLMGEHIRGLEAVADIVGAGATDYVRASDRADGGITGVMKIAALAEAHGLDVELHGRSSQHPLL